MTKPTQFRTTKAINLQPVHCPYWTSDFVDCPSIYFFKIPFIKLICLYLGFLILYRNVLCTPDTSMDPTLQMKHLPSFWQVFVAREIKQQGLVSSLKLQEVSGSEPLFSPFQGHLSPKIIFHRRLSSIKGSLPSQVIFHQRQSSIQTLSSKKG